MTNTTPILSLPLIQAAQAQKHLTHNDSINILDALVQLSVIDDALTVPPSDPALGDRYIVAAGGAGAWTAADGNLAVWEGGGWMLYEPKIGWVAYVESRSGLMNYSATGWTPITAAAAPLPETVSRWGINATADNTNRLAVAADATLFNHGGSGHQLKINKAGAAHTASLMFQSNWAGKAEMGLAGEDAFSIKVNADALGWTTALRVDPNTGALRAPAGGVRETALSALHFYVDATLGNDTQEGSIAAPLATIQAALDRIAAQDGQGQMAVISLTDGTHSLPAALQWPQAIPGLQGIRLQSASGNPASVTLNIGSFGLSFAHGAFEMADLSLTGTTGSLAAVTVQTGGQLTISNIAFSNPGAACLEADGGHVRLTAMTLNGNADRLLHARANGVIDARNASLTLQGTPALAVAGYQASLGGIIDLAGSTLTNTASGKSYDVTGNAVLNAPGIPLPGDIPGTTASGGVVL